MKTINKSDQMLNQGVVTTSVVSTTCTLALIGSIAMADMSSPNSVELISQQDISLRPDDMQHASVSSVTILKPSLLNEELNQVVADAENEDPCSGESVQVNEESVLRAKQFISNLQGKECDLEFCIDNDGYVVLEWYRATLLQMSVTFAEKGMLYVERFWGERSADNVLYGREDEVLTMMRKIVYANV